MTSTSPSSFLSFHPFPPRQTPNSCNTFPQLSWLSTSPSDKLVEQGAGIAASQEATVNNLLAQKTELTKHRDMLNDSVSTLSKQNAELVSEFEKIESEKSEGQLEIQSLKELTTSKQSELERERRRIDRIDKDLTELRAHVAAQAEVLVNQQSTFEIQRERTQLIEQQFKEQKRTLSSLMVQEQRLQTDLDTIDEMMRRETARKDGQTRRNQELKAEIKSSHETQRVRRQELDKTQRRFADEKRSRRIDELKYADVVAQKDGLVGEIREHIKSIERIYVFAQKDDLKINQLLHERDLLNKAIIKNDEKSKDQMERVKIYNSASASSREDITKWKAKVATALKRVEELDKSRERAGLDLSVANHKYLMTLDRVKQSDNKITELRKVNQELKSKLNHQKDLYQSVRSDRNLYSRNLIESQDEIAELRRKFKIMFQQIEQLREEISEKDETLKNEIADYDR